MLIDVTMTVLGAKRREYQGKVYCDLFASEKMADSADQVGQSVESYRADGIVVDELRHKTLPGTFKCQADMQRFGKTSVLVIRHIGDPVVAAATPPRLSATK